MHRPRPWWDLAAASQRARPSHGLEADRSTVLLHNLWMDDVELARVRSSVRGDTLALRRLTLRPRWAHHVRVCRGRTHDAFRYFGEIHRRAVKDRRQASRRLRLVERSFDPVDGQPARSRKL